MSVQMGSPRGTESVVQNASELHAGDYAARLAEHAAAVRSLDAQLHGRPHLLAGIEVDILPTGALDLPEEALAGLDCVVAAIHSRFVDPAPRNTERIVRALRSGVVHVLGHPTGRQIGTREAYPLDLERVLEDRAGRTANDLFTDPIPHGALEPRPTTSSWRGSSSAQVRSAERPYPAWADPTGPHRRTVGVE